MKLAIRNGNIIDPANGIDMVGDILIEDGIIKAVGKIDVKADQEIDAKGFIVAPGFIDMHVHLREPGREDKETILTCSRAAARGGITTIAGMPNTTPIADDQTVIAYVVEKAKEAVVNVLPIGAMTKGIKGKEMAPVGDLVNAGAVAVSDDGGPVQDAGLMLKCLQYLERWGIPYISHSEDVNLSGSGVMHEGKVSTELGLEGIPPEAEAVCVGKEIILSEATGTHIHFAHISTKQSVELIRDAKRRRVNISAETCPHYFCLTDESVRGYDSNAKINPPLRSEKHRKAVIEAIIDGTIDCIVTDHAPHTLVEKFLEFDHCQNGIVGLETSVPLSMTKLIGEKHIGVKDLIEKFTVNPAKILNIDKGTLGVGKVADITIIDPKKKQVVDKESFESKGRNTPFDGMELTGWPVKTIVAGKVVFDGKNVI